MIRLNVENISKPESLLFLYSVFVQFSCVYFLTNKPNNKSLRGAPHQLSVCKIFRKADGRHDFHVGNIKKKKNVFDRGNCNGDIRTARAAAAAEWSHAALYVYRLPTRGWRFRTVRLCSRPCNYSDFYCFYFLFCFFFPPFSSFDPWIYCDPTAFDGTFNICANTPFCTIHHRLERVRVRTIRAPISYPVGFSNVSHVFIVHYHDRACERPKIITRRVRRNGAISVPMPYVRLRRTYIS